MEELMNTGNERCDGRGGVSTFPDHGNTSHSFSAADLADALELINEESGKSSNTGHNPFSQGAACSPYADLPTLPEYPPSYYYPSPTYNNSPSITLPTHHSNSPISQCGSNQTARKQVEYTSPQKKSCSPGTNATSTSGASPLASQKRNRDHVVDVYPQPCAHVLLKLVPPSDPAPYWSQVMYYELDSKHGEVYKAAAGQNTFYVDGFTAAVEPDRFCLGAVGNANRCATVINVRRQIGRGIRVSKLASSVELVCLSDSPVFVQSPMHAHTAGDNLSTVYRVSSDNAIEVFNDAAFEALIRKTIHQGYNGIYALQNMCHLRVSFVKGFGADYRRQTIHSTPSWIEIHFLQPLQRLDWILQQMKGPVAAISSFS